MSLAELSGGQSARVPWVHNIAAAEGGRSAGGWIG